MPLLRSLVLLQRWLSGLTPKIGGRPAFEVLGYVASVHEARLWRAVRQCSFDAMGFLRDGFCVVESQITPGELFNSMAYDIQLVCTM
jgi:hypothetical protein